VGDPREGACRSHRLSLAHQPVHRHGTDVPVRARRSGEEGRRTRRIVRGADTDARQLTPESAGLYALATGFQAMTKDDFENMAKQFPGYEALYAYCRATTK